MNCTHCAAENPDVANFCAVCGKAISRSKQGTVTDEHTGFSAEGAPVYDAAPPGKRARSHKRFAAVALFLAAVTITVSIAFQKSDEDKIISRLNDIAAAYNEADVDKLVGCFDPKTQKGLKAAMGIGSKLMGLEVEDILGALFSFAPGLSGDDVTFYVKIHAIEIKSKTEATADITFCYGGIEDRFPAHLIKSGGQWYLYESISLF